MIVELIFRLVFDNHVLINPTTMHSASSVLDCARLCRFPYSSFFYNQAQHQCVLSNILYEKTHPAIENAMGWNYYSFTGDVDECTAGFDNCHADATCTNTDGSFTCACNAGYNGDGVTCTDVDECTNGSDNCHADATCTNTVGSFTCACNAGYNGDGVTCTDSCLPPYRRLAEVNLCIKVVTNPKLNFDEAIVACQNDGARLVHLDTRLKIELFRAIHMTEYINIGMYIGLRDEPLYAKLDYRWTDGSVLTVDNWGSGQPQTNRWENCVAIEAGRNYMWADVYCSDRNAYVCEIVQ